LRGHEFNPFGGRDHGEALGADLFLRYLIQILNRVNTHLIPNGFIPPLTGWLTLCQWWELVIVKVNVGEIHVQDVLALLGGG